MKRWTRLDTEYAGWFVLGLGFGIAAILAGAALIVLAANS